MSDSESVRILVLEDNVVDAELLSRQLRDDGLQFQSRVVASEPAFRRALAEFSPQVVLSDFTLPQFDGLSALDIVATTAPQVPFIFVSGTIGEERAIEALKRGASDYLLKGSLRRLVPAIRGALRQAEAARARDVAEDMLRRSQSRLQDIIDTSYDWIWECDGEARFTFSSPSVADILGFDRHQLLGRSSADYVETVDAKRLESLFADFGPDERVREGTLRWRHRNGRMRWLERKMTVLRDSDGRIVGFRGIDRDVSVRKAQELRISRLNRALRFLSGANSAIVRLRSRPQLLGEACRLAVRVGGYALATIHLSGSGPDDEWMTYREARDDALAAQLPDPDEASRAEGPVAAVLTTLEPVVVRDLADSGVVVPGREQLLGAGLRACIALPLIVEDQAIGVLELHSKERGAFRDAELALLRQVSGNITFSLRYLQSKQSAQYLEHFDPLTALANRALYVQRLDAMIRTASPEHRPVALLAFGIVGLSTINDGLGYHAGDLLLQLIAKRMSKAFDGTECLCRLGGDRYAVATTADPGSAAGSARLQERVSAVFEDAFTLSGQEIRVAIRAGITQFPDDGGEAESLLQQAETALGRAKESGQRYLRHRPGMSVQASERLSMTNRLRRAVAEEQFVLHYQAKQEIASGAIDGVEALLRWPLPCAEPVSPGTFVPMLERLGLIDSVGTWVIERALAETAPWFTTADKPFKVAVNVSPMQLDRDGFVDDVLGLLGKVPDAARHVEIEVTESTLMRDPERAREILQRLRDAGASIAIDDFGTGHSSLRLLAGLPVDVLKIDRSFVRDLAKNHRHRLIVQTTIGLASSLGLRTVAEGVETHEQFGLLSDLGCDVAQGFLIHRPASAPDVDRWLQHTCGAGQSDAAPQQAHSCGEGDR
jgi:diguanylate cyclase (GGDEF)-like protein/PAS domain S-box-containing protein